MGGYGEESRDKEDDKSSLMAHLSWEGLGRCNGSSTRPLYPWHCEAGDGKDEIEWMN